MRNSLAISAVAPLALLAGSAAFAQMNATRVASDLSLVVDGGAQVAVMPVIGETAQSDLLTYDFLANEVQFSAGVLAPDYDEPLFCFDMGQPQTAVTMRATDPNGHVIIEGFSIQASVNYVLSSPSSLVVTPSVNQQCFFRSDAGDFGLFGETATGEPEPAGLIMRNRFEVERSVSLEFQNVPQFVTLGETISYDLVVTNTGNGDLNQVGLQELFPENRGVYAAALNSTSWTCSASGDAVCPAASGTDPLRFEDFNAGGADITVGDSLTFSIQRTVDATSITGESIRLQAGVVADPVSSGAPFAVDEALMTVIGQSAGLSVSAPAAEVDNDAVITVTVLDGNQNPVPDETVTVSNTAGLSFTSPTSGISDTNGEVVFTATTTTAGDYSVGFSAGSLNGNGTVTFDPGPATIMVAAALDDEAVADGQDAVSINVLVEDDFGNAVDSVAVDVIDDGGLVSLPASVFTDVDGIASFAPTSTVAGNYQIQFSVSGAGTDAVAVDFVPGAPSDLRFEVQPTDVEVGSPISPAVVVRVVDANGNWVNDDQTTFVQLRLRQSGVTVDANFASGTVINGEAEFANLDQFTSNMVGTGYSFRAVGTTDNDIFLEDSAGFAVSEPPQ